MRTYYTKLLLTILSSLALFLAPQLVDAQCSADAGPNVTICQGESVTLGGNPTAVNPNPGTVTYNWDNGAADVANPVVSPNSTTTYEVELGENLEKPYKSV